MIKANRGGRKLNHRSDRAEQSSSSSSWKPLNHDQTLTPELDSTSSPSTSQHLNLEPISNSGPRISRHTRNPNWVSRNRHGHGLKPQFVKKSDVGSSDIEVGSLRIDERVDGQVENDMVEKDEREGGGNGSGSKKIEEETIDVMDILEELRLSVEEPELSEEQLITNFQSQEDEVVD